jgi:hypothetical protein
MSQNAAPHLRPQPTQATYWRRRAVALAVGMAVLCLLAWAVSGVIG